MYQRLPSWTLGFHGTDESTVQKILNDKSGHVEQSRNAWDWLGNGAYFWENDPTRAFQFATSRMKWLGITDTKPAVIGAVIDLGRCLNLFDQPGLVELKAAYKSLEDDAASVGMPLPENHGKTPDRIFRRLDRAVFENLHLIRSFLRYDAYDTTRAPFMEGAPLYNNTSFRERNHIQIAVRNMACIKGYFLPRGL
ncbi:MAG: hypothetical protein H7346_18395 [Burkholderiaceae bacterium]|nr:hypothetical protein [Burkholderiaceae bacterium]